MKFVNESTVELYKSNAADIDVARAAWVSQDEEAHTKEREEGRVAGLIDFLWRNGHTSPFEHGQFTFIVHTPIFVAREFMRHRTMCIAGDTEITFSNGKRQGAANQISTHKKTIAEHWEHFNLGVLDSLGRRRVLPSVRSATVLSMDEETGERAYSTVLDVIQSGVKPVYRMTTARGRSVKASNDHKFLTVEGWKPLKDIEEGDEVLTSHRAYADQSEQRTVPWSLRTAINTWTSQQRKVVFDRDSGKCRKCNVVVTRSTSRCDHIVPVAADLEKALSLSNLQLLCQGCDKEKTRLEQSYAERGNQQVRPFSPDLVTQIEYVGEEMTYDLVLDDPHHNFMGNGIVTHNSYNEVSGRYTELEPEFYVPPKERPLQQKGKVGNYTFEAGDEYQRAKARYFLETASTSAVGDYEELLESGIAKEVARMVLPVNIMTTFWATVNPLNLMKFLSLRTAPDALYEIREVAYEMERHFLDVMPLTWATWSGGQSPLRNGGHR